MHYNNDDDDDDDKKTSSTHIVTINNKTCSLHFAWPTLKWEVGQWSSENQLLLYSLLS
jgi:hypothetical protein